MQCSDIARELAVPTGAVDAAEVERHLAACPSCARRAAVERRFDRLWGATRPVAPPSSAFDALWSRVEAAVEAPAANGTLATDPVATIHLGDLEPPRKRFGRRAALVAAVALAQAASILLTAVIVARAVSDREAPGRAGGTDFIASTGTPTDAPSPSSRVAEEGAIDPAPGEPSALAQVVFDLEDGQTLIFRLDDHEGRIVVYPRSIDLADDLVAFESDLDGPDAWADPMKLDVNILNAMEPIDVDNGLAFFRDDEPAEDAPHGRASEPDAGDRPPGTSARPAGSSLPEVALPALVGLMPPYPGLAGEPGGPYRQVTVFGIVATPDDDAVDPKLDVIADDLRLLKPGHGFQVRGVESRRLGSGEAVDCDLGDGTVARAELEDALDPATGKLRIRFTMAVDGREAFTTTVTASPNQVFFCDKPLGEGVRLLIGIGAR